VVFAEYDKIENSMKIDAETDPKSDAKIDIWVLRGPIFEILGRFLNNPIFD